MVGLVSITKIQKRVVFSKFQSADIAYLFVRCYFSRSMKEMGMVVLA